METLLAGLLIFLGAHSVRIVAPGWRERRIAQLGANGWKGLYSLVSLAGLVLIVWGYGMTRGVPELWSPPVWTRHLASLLTMVSFVLVTAAYVPKNRIKAALGHPMVAGVKIWAFAHLISNGRPGDIVLFGAFMVWAIVTFLAARRRDRAAGTRYPPGALAGDLLVVAIGLAAWALFAFDGHQWLIGVRPFG
ncbi:MAG: NnrU family protein [Betaproteobacteria bacterium]|nr:NnrU family protein [Betaproteobacteria bacterium]